jgi:hypothetical protein
MEPAMERLRGLVAHASNPQAIFDAMRELDRRLSTDPEGESESRADLPRVAFETPLGVSFEIVENRIEIGSVWRIRPT